MLLDFRSRTLNCALPVSGPRLANLQIRSLPVGFDDPMCAHYPCHFDKVEICAKRSARTMGNRLLQNSERFLTFFPEISTLNVQALCIP